MADLDYSTVVGEGGVTGYIVGPSEDNPDEVVVALENGREISVPTSSLRLGNDRKWHLPESLLPRETQPETEVIPVIAEEAQISKRKRVTGTLRVAKDTHERQEKYTMPLTRARAEVRRVIIDKPVESAPPIRREGNTIIFPVVEEQVVMQKRLVLKEEIHVSRRRTTERHEETVTLREEQPRIERLDASGQVISEPATKAHAQQPPLRNTERSVIDPSVPRPSVLGPQPRRPVRRNKILREE